jgi:hypothetical protein
VLGIAKQRGDLIDLRGGKQLSKRIIKDTAKADVESLKNEFSPAFGRKLNKVMKGFYGKTNINAAGAQSTAPETALILPKLNAHGELQSQALALKNKKYRKIAGKMVKAYLPDPTNVINHEVRYNKDANDLVSGVIGMHELSEQKALRDIIRGKAPVGSTFARQGFDVLSSHVGQQVLEDLKRGNTLKGPGADAARRNVLKMREPEVGHMLRVLGRKPKSRYNYGDIPNEANATPLQKLVSAQQSDKLIGQEATDLAFENEAHNRKILSKVPERLHNHPMVQSRLKSMSVNDAIDELKNTKYKMNSKMRNYVYKKLDEKTLPGESHISKYTNELDPQNANLMDLRADPKLFKNNMGGRSTRMRRK